MIEVKVESSFKNLGSSENSDATSAFSLKSWPFLDLIRLRLELIFGMRNEIYFVEFEYIHIDSRYTILFVKNDVNCKVGNANDIQNRL